MGNDLTLEARQRVVSFFNDFRLEGVPEIGLDSVYVVWYCVILGNWKALVSTVIPDEMYYEVTYNVETGETYIDAYSKMINVAISPDNQPDPNQLTLPISDIPGERHG
jgi:hypothetical protein